MKIYNTLTRRKEDFVSVEPNKAMIYVCGPTVYNYIHIGNARPMVIFDTLRRFLLYKGMDVKYVVNFTDVDDKIINAAKEQGVAFTDITEKYIEAFLENARGLNLYEEKTMHPRATEYIDEMIEFIDGLVRTGAAYNVDGNVYFHVADAKDYGKLSKKNIDDLEAGARIDISDEKRDPLDFALWKKQKDPEEPAWESPWGMGRPGWHIECSVMAKSLLGDTIDIHAGGEDLQFPHHENEIAQSETLTGKPFAKYWMHNSMITVDKKKMSKSLGNFFTLVDIEKQYDLSVVRLWLLSAHYRNPIDFSQEAMEQTKNGLERLKNGKENMERLLSATKNVERKPEEEKIFLQLDQDKAAFIAAMEDDLNTADAVSKLYEIVRTANTEFDEETSEELLQYALDLFLELSDVLGLVYPADSIDEEVEALIEQRNVARAEKNYAEADAIRDKLKDMGIELKDTPTGVQWSRK
jgi:cysteinyl-tRNA synthetase